MQPHKSTSLRLCEFHSEDETLWRMEALHTSVSSLSPHLHLFNRSADDFIQSDLEMRITETEVIKARETILVQPNQISFEY